MYMAGRYQDALKAIAPFDGSGSEETEKLLVIIEAALGHGEAQAKHVRELMKLNKKAAEELIEGFLLVSG
jgi:hypothetical protein